MLVIWGWEIYDNSGCTVTYEAVYYEGVRE